MVLIAIISFYVYFKNESKTIIKLMLHIGATIKYSLGGAIAGYFIGVAAFCFRAEAGTQCGFIAVFFTAPLGLLIGAAYYQYKWVNNHKNPNKSLNQTGANGAPPG